MTLIPLSGAFEQTTEIDGHGNRGRKKSVHRGNKVFTLSGEDLSGKNYTVLDGDIIFFKFNAGAGLTAKKK